VNREKILTEGRSIVGKLLIELQVRKSTADGEGSRTYYEQLTKPLDSWSGELRDLAIKKKQVRRIELFERRDVGNRADLAYV
jgi:dipeptidyl-peptidase-3